MAFKMKYSPNKKTGYGFPYKGEASPNKFLGRMARGLAGGARRLLGGRGGGGPQLPSIFGGVLGGGMLGAAFAPGALGGIMGGRRAKIMAAKRNAARGATLAAQNNVDIPANIESSMTKKRKH